MNYRGLKYILFLSIFVQLLVACGTPPPTTLPPTDTSQPSSATPLPPLGCDPDTGEGCECDPETGEGCGPPPPDCDPETGEGCECDPETGEGCGPMQVPTYIPTDTLLERRYPTTMKGISEPGFLFENFEDLDRIKKLGVNTFYIDIAYQRKNGDYVIVDPQEYNDPASEQWAGEIVRRAKAAGFSVMLRLQVGVGFGFVEQFDDWEEFKEDTIDVAVHWAALAEELQVEYYMPFMEFNKFLLIDLENPQQPGEPRYTFDEAMGMIAEWDSMALPQIRANYSGLVINQCAPLGDIMQHPVEGYDVYGFVYAMPDAANIMDIENNNEVRAQTRNLFEQVQGLAQQNTIDWMVVEAFVMRDAFEPWSDVEDPYKTQSEIYRVAAEEYMEVTTVPPVGFGIITWSWGDTGIKDTPSEDVIRQFFDSLDSINKPLPMVVVLVPEVPPVNYTKSIALEKEMMVESEIHVRK